MDSTKRPAKATAPLRPSARRKHASQPRPDAGPRFGRLVEIMQTLRSSEGCPWDREQTLDSLRPFLLEETYEVLDAIDRGDQAALRDEIGDLLFEAAFLAQLCAEEGHFTIADALHAITDKLIRRHPHVFGDTASHAPGGSTGPISASQVLERWEQLKAQERTDSSARRTLLSGIAPTLPALLRAYEIGSRVASVGFDWDRPRDVVGKMQEEVTELRNAIGDTGRQDQGKDAEDEMGDLLFTIANLARKLGIEPEAALRRANDKFARRFAELERRLVERGSSVHAASLEEMEQEWRRIKSGG